jgi:5-methylcytosine-specific restriction endonuclease McrA
VAQRGLRQLTCNRCSSEFLGRKGQRYCSRKCSAFDRSGAGLRANKTSFGAGGMPWNKGLKAWRKGYSHSVETREAIRRGNSGERSGAWRGGLTEIHYRIRRSQRYAHWRTAVFVRDNFTCQMCCARSVAGARVRLEADHIKPFADFPDLRFDVDNGRTLCSSCHRKTPTWGRPQTATRLTDGQESRQEAAPAHA